MWSKSLGFLGNEKGTKTHKRNVQTFKRKRQTPESQRTELAPQTFAVLRKPVKRMALKHLGKDAGLSGCPRGRLPPPPAVLQRPWSFRQRIPEPAAGIEQLPCYKPQGREVGPESLFTWIPTPSSSWTLNSLMRSRTAQGRGRPFGTHMHTHAHAHTLV